MLVCINKIWLIPFYPSFLISIHSFCPYFLLLTHLYPSVWFFQSLIPCICSFSLPSVHLSFQSCLQIYVLPSFPVSPILFFSSVTSIQISFLPLTFVFFLACLVLKALVLRALHGLLPLYISVLLHFHTPGRPLMFSNQMLLSVPSYRQKHCDDWAFAVRAPVLWTLGLLLTLVQTEAFVCSFYDVIVILYD